jgi:hypothetical protein
MPGLIMMRTNLMQRYAGIKDIPVLSNVTRQQELDNYYQVKMEVKRLIGLW